MKFGTYLFLLVIILISFGYVLSDDQQARIRLDQALADMENLKMQVVQSNQQLSSCQATVQNDNQVIAQQVNTIEVLKVANLQQAGRILNLERNGLQTIQSSSASWQLNPVVVAVFLLAQLSLFVVQRRNRKYYVRLSGEERSLIIQMRRKKKM